jgi:hypothetical protein
VPSEFTLGLKGFWFSVETFKKGAVTWTRSSANDGGDETTQAVVKTTKER